MCGRTPTGPDGLCDEHTTDPARDTDRIEGPNTTFGRCPKCRRIVNLNVGPDGVADRRPPLCAQCAAEQQHTTAPEGEEGNIMSAMTSAGSSGPSVEVRTLPGFIDACEKIAALIVNVSEQATGFGLQPAAQAGLTDAGDMMRNVAASARATYAALIEAADSTPQGAEQVTVAAARNE
jgi:hypothetical protein